MSEVNILLGVGGTGAKVVEASLVLLAAGLGPRNVHVGLIDQDSTNGNVMRTRSLLSSYIDFRRRWSGSTNKIDWSRENSPDFGRTTLVPLLEKPQPDPFWCPAQKSGSLKSIIGQNLPDDQRHLFDLLFMTGGEEQDLPLDQGYRGRAHVGSAALVASLLDENCALTARLSELMESAGQESVNIFIVGSAFGGTGAAGFPTLARHLNNLRSNENLLNREKIKIAGLLMLPYFEFRNPGNEKVSVVTSNELTPKTQLALEYYENLFKHEQVFDRFFVLGWRPTLFKLNYHAAGSEEQTNPALLPELVAATSVCDFFNNDDFARGELGEAGSKVPVLSAGRENQSIKWRDLPGNGVREKLGQLLRFAMYWRYQAKPLLTRKTGWLGGRTWAQALSKGVNVEQSSDDIASLDRVVDAILTWAMTIEKMGERYWVNGPWTLDALRDPDHHETPTEPVKLGARFSDQHALDAFDAMVRVDSGESEPRKGKDVETMLVKETIGAGDHRGIGRAVVAAYEAVTVEQGS